MFFVNGAAGASWLVRIPDVRDGLGLSPGELGGALLGAPLGALVGVPVAGWLVGHFGSRWVTVAAALATCGALPLPAVAPNLPLLAAALGLLGISYGALDMAMNAQAVAVEGRYGRPLMSSFHAFFSVGGIAGSFASGLVAARGVPPLPDLLGAAAILGGVGVVAGGFLLPTPPSQIAAGQVFAWPARAILGLGVFAFCVLLSEGAVADWSAVYLRDALGANPALAAAGYGVFSLAMAAGRLAGDSLIARLGPERVARLGGSLAATGFALALVARDPLPALVGFGCTGVGLSALFPLALSAAGRVRSLPSSTALAAVTTLGYAGLLAGPPLIGLTAQLATLPVALGLVVLLCVLSALLAPMVGDPAGVPRTAPG
jgi:MFS family permease